MKNENDLLSGYFTFLDKIASNLSKVRIDTSKWQLDHIAYRAKTRESYERTNNTIDYAKKVNTKMIRGREVDMYLLDQPLTYKDWQFKYFEILAPAEGDNFTEGLEHAEFVVDIDLHELVKTHPEINWNINSIDRPIGAEVGIIFDNGANVKFKRQTMEEIIKLEEMSWG